MKKLFLFVFLLVPFNLQARVEDPAAIAPVADTGSSALEESASTSCEIDEDSISSIRFYAGNCLNRRDDLVDVDLNIQCITHAPVYRSYCREENYGCFPGTSAGPGSFSVPLCIRLLPESAQTCLTRLHCARGTPAPMPPMPPSAEVTVTSIAPTTAQAGSAAFTLTVTGTNFTNASIVLWNGRNKTTTYVSATELRAQIDAADIAHAASIPVTVMTGTRVSSGINFTITAAGTTGTGTPPADVPGVTSPATSIGNPSTTPPIGTGNGGSGGCVLALGTSESMSFAFVSISFVLGSFLLLRKKK